MDRARGCKGCCAPRPEIGWGFLALRTSEGKHALLIKPFYPPPNVNIPVKISTSALSSLLPLTAPLAVLGTWSVA